LPALVEQFVALIDQLAVCGSAFPQSLPT
jgi:hypothetical protein